MDGNSSSATISRSVRVDLRSGWRIRDVEIPARLVLAPMAGLSVQAFSPSGPPLWRRARLLGDGQRRHPAPRERADCRLPAHFAGRAAAGRADLRLRAGGDG